MQLTIWSIFDEDLDVLNEYLFICFVIKLSCSDLGSYPYNFWPKKVFICSLETILLANMLEFSFLNSSLLSFASSLKSKSPIYLLAKYKFPLMLSTFRVIF